MFEISKLKEKKLSELQEIAEKLKISKFKTLKKLDLVYKILDYQASNPEEKEVKQEESKEQPKSKFKAKAKTPKNKPDEKKSVDEKKSHPERKHHTSKREGNHRKPRTEPNGNRDNRNRYKEPRRSTMKV